MPGIAFHAVGIDQDAVGVMALDELQAMVHLGGMNHVHPFRDEEIVDLQVEAALRQQREQEMGLARGRLFRQRAVFASHANCKGNAKRKTLPLPARSKPDTAAVQTHDILSDRQANARAAVLARRRTVVLVKRVKTLSSASGGIPMPVSLTTASTDPRAHGFRRSRFAWRLNLTAFDNRLLKTCPILPLSPSTMTFSSGASSATWTERLSRRVGHSGCCRGRTRPGRTVEDEFFGASMQAREVEQVLDQRHELLDVPQNDARYSRCVSLMGPPCR